MSPEPTLVGVSDADIEAIRRAAMDYLEGFLSGDSRRHLDAYHAEATKRRMTQGEHGATEVYSQWWVDFLHVVKARGSWKLFHVTSYPRT